MGAVAHDDDFPESAREGPGYLMKCRRYPKSGTAEPTFCPSFG